MAAINYGDYGDSAHGGSFAAALNWAGAFLSILLIAGLATWGWKLWVRDVTGVPVVRALEGPMRVAPEEPGGLASNYQGLTVNRIAEAQVEETPADQVILAPQPTILDEGEDLAMAELPPVIDAQEDRLAIEESTALAPVSEETALAANEPATLTIEEDPMASVLPDTANAEALVPEATSLSATDLAVQLALGLGDDAGRETGEARIIAAAHVPSISPRPLVRPANLRVAAVPAPVQSDNALPGAVDPDAIPPGTRLVQLGAYADRNVAEVEWKNRMDRFGDYMVGKAPVVLEAETGGRAFYRLRATGFDDLADASRFCSVLVAEGATCIPVVHE